jgi:hypothetical protein
MGHALPPAKDHLRADSGLGRFLGLGRGSGSVWDRVLRTACASISRSSALVFAGSRGVGFHEVMSSIIGRCGRRNRGRVALKSGTAEGRTIVQRGCQTKTPPMASVAPTCGRT